MELTKKQIETILIKIHKKYSKSRKSDNKSDACSIWSTDNPPDVLQCTPQLDEIEKYINFNFEEMEAFTFYDMDIKDAASYIFNIIKNYG